MNHHSRGVVQHCCHLGQSAIPGAIDLVYERWQYKHFESVCCPGPIRSPQDKWLSM
jgi:hypothetical protein